MIVTPSGKPSEGFDRYAHHLIAERLLGRHVDTYTSPWMERGAALESEAIDWYEFEYAETLPIGFITTDDARIGCSPDRLIGDDGLLEIKVPGPAGQVGYLLTGKIQHKYKPQIQGQLWISDRQWVDILAWNPELPRIVVREERDEKFIAVLERQVTNFADELDKAMEKIKSVSRRPKAALAEMLRASLGE
jgi:hypothetical protein